MKTPNGWVITTVGEVMIEVKDRVDPTEIADVKYIGLEHLEKGGGIIGYGSSKETKSQKAVFRKGDVLYGKLRPYLNKHALVDFDGVCSTDILIYRNDEVVISSLFNYFLSLEETIEKANSESKGINLPRISSKVLNKFAFPLPPLPEQHRIVAKLDRLFGHLEAARARLARVPDLLADFRQAVLSRAVTGALTAEWREENNEIENGGNLIRRLVDNRIKSYEKELKVSEETGDRRPRKPRFIGKKYQMSEYYKIPESWAWDNVDRLFDVAIGGTPSRREPSYWGGDLYWISSGEVANNIIEDSEEKITLAGLNNSSVKLYPKGTVLIAMIGEGKTRGQASLLNIEAGTNQNIAALLIDNSYINSRYIWYVFLERYEKTRSRASGGNQPALNGIKIGQFSIPIPPLKEQQEIVRRIDSLFAKADAIEARYEVLREEINQLPQAILAKAFRGELVEKNPNDEPAEELLKKIELEKAKLAKELKEAKKKRQSNRIKKQVMKDLEILEVLQANKQPMKAAEVWKNSKYKNDIDAFYRALRREVEVERNVKQTMGKDKVAYLSII